MSPPRGSAGEDDGPTHEREALADGQPQARAPCLRVTVASPCPKGLKSRATCSGVMPGPVSFTSMTRRASSPATAGGDIHGDLARVGELGAGSRRGS